MRKHAKKRVRLNQYTGEPRKWVCYNHGGINAWLEELEAFYFYYHKAKRKGPVSPSWYHLLPRAFLEEQVRGLTCQLRGMSEALEAKEAAELSVAELRYCEAEGIKPEDFLKAKGDQ